MKIPVSPAEMVAIQRKCIEANNLSDSYIRLVVTRGYGTLGLDPRKCPVPGVICIADTISLFPQEMYEQGMRVIVANRPKTPIPCLDPRIKTLNYLNNILAKCEAIDYGCHEVIMLNTDGFVTEGSGDNIFIIKNGEIFTPPSEAGILEGITRMFVKTRLAPMLGIKVTEKELRLEDVLTADEVFLDRHAAEIIACTQIDQHDGKQITKVNYVGRWLGKKAPPEGPITKKLRHKFREIVTSDAVPGGVVVAKRRTRQSRQKDDSAKTEQQFGFPFPLSEFTFGESGSRSGVMGRRKNRAATIRMPFDSHPQADRIQILSGEIPEGRYTKNEDRRLKAELAGTLAFQLIEPIRKSLKQQLIEAEKSR